MTLDPPPLLKFIPQHSPEFEEPVHMGSVGDLFAEALATVRGERSEPVRALCTYPIRHFKTETFLHGIVWLLLHEPTLRIVVLTYSHGRAKDVGKRLRELADRTTVGPARGWNTIEDWKNEAGGGVVVMSAEQSKEGYDCHVLLCDDPIDEHGASTPEQRELVDRAINYYTARCMRKGRPGPVLLIMSRQHPDDPIGRRLARRAVKWTHLHQPAIIDEGTPQERPFAPLVWPLEELHRLRAELRESDPMEIVWWSRFMGLPRAPGATFFRDNPARYEMIPPWAFRDAIGIDMAFSPKRTADWFAVCVLRFVSGRTYIRHVERFKADPREVPIAMNRAQALCAGGDAPIFSYMSGPERGNVITLANDHGIVVQPMQPRVNKLWRSQRTIARWNAGDILVPADAPWAVGFIKRAAAFTGAEGEDDDEVDALVSACDAMLGFPSDGPKPLGQWRL